MALQGSATKSMISEVEDQQNQRLTKLLFGQAWVKSGTLKCIPFGRAEFGLNLGIRATLRDGALPNAAFNIRQDGLGRETCLSAESMGPPANFASPPISDFRDRWHHGTVLVSD